MINYNVDPGYIIVEAAPCEGGLQLAEVYPGEGEDEAARRAGAVVRCYGRGCPAEPGRQEPHTHEGARRCAALIEEEDAR